MLSSFVARQPIERDDWYIDSGASGHMTMRGDWILDGRSTVHKEVIVADNSRLSVECVGDIRVAIQRDGHSANVLIRNVQYVPGICANLISVAQLIRQGISSATMDVVFWTRTKN